MAMEIEPSRSDLTLQAGVFQNLCRYAGLHEPVQVDCVAAGRNNRIFRLGNNGRTVIAKLYFHHASDPRDRLKQEFGFLDYLYCRGVRNVPRPIWADPRNHLGVYEFLPGRRPRLEEIGPRHIEQAINFYRRINVDRQAFTARALPSASEACFSMTDHLACVEQRVERLKGIKIENDLDQAARDFVAFEVLPLWMQVRARAISGFKRAESLDQHLDPDACCLSPSDFGFHNTLADDSGTLTFLDFEYAGWDDPAKLVCDFANQPDMPLSEELSRSFQSAVVTDDPAPDYLMRRIFCLMPVYQIKWCCIILNDFLPQGRERAFFLGRTGNGEGRKEKQLVKARDMLKRAERCLERSD